MLDKNGHLDANRKKAIIRIVQDFLDNDAFDVSEEQVQLDYIAPLLRELGWTAKRRKINTVQERNAKNRRPDIMLLNDIEASLFIIESKAPKESLDNPEFRNKLYDYCNSEGLYWGILTNFVEWQLFSIYQERPYFNKQIIICDRENKKVTISEEGWEMFEKIAYDFLNLNAGKIDDKNGYYPEVKNVKDDFFKKLKAWRTEIRDYLIGYTKIKDREKANLETQLILDRLIFMKVCFDRKLLPNDALEIISYTPRHKYDVLKKEFGHLNEIFDSRLFYQALSDKVTISDHIISSIINDFKKLNLSLLSAHIMGEVYEDYLSEILKEKQPSEANQKKKKQGIYYTPEYIVNYMVENTVDIALGKVKTLAQLRKIRVLDPACGSGHFLIRAFDSFHRKYRQFYKKNDEQPLPLQVEKEILLNNLYGVDLDEKAVQITQLNLLLKAMENVRLRDLRGRKLLPDLSLNIRCGNSLISGNEVSIQERFHNELQELSLLREGFKKAIEDDKRQEYLQRITGIEKKINQDPDLPQFTDVMAFNYSVAFSEVFADGGFDIVVGNPPYVQLQKLARTKTQQDLESQNFITFTKHADLYCLFYEKGIQLLKNKGVLSYITSNKWLRSTYGEKLREFFLKYSNPLKLLDFGGSKIFVDAAVDTNILITEKTQNTHMLSAVHFKDDYKGGDNLENYVKRHTVVLTDLNSTPWFIGSSAEVALKKKIEHIGKPLKDWVFEITYGVKTGLNEAFIINRSKRDELIKEDSKSADIIKPILRGRDITRYGYNFAEQYVIVVKYGFAKELIKYPAVLKYLKGFEEQLRARGQCNTSRNGKKVSGKIGETGQHHWLELDNNPGNKYLKEFEKEKVVWAETMRVHKNENVKFPRFSIVPSGIYLDKTCFFFTSGKYNYYFVGVLNSCLGKYMIKTYVDKLDSGGYMMQKTFIEHLPIPPIDTPERETMAAKITSVVRKILAKKQSDPKLDIQYLEDHLDELVCKLYELSQQEIEIVKGTREDVEMAYLKFMTQLKKLESYSDRSQFIQQHSDEALDLIFAGLDKYTEGHTVSAEEDRAIKELKTLLKDRPPLRQAKHSA